MPNGYESPLNKLADALPGFILQMQDMRMRQEAQESLNQYRQNLLGREIERERAERKTKEAIEQVKRDMGIYEPPEFKLLLDNISYELRALNDPDIGLTLDDPDIIKRWKKVTNMEADYYGKTGRHVSISMPIPVEGALAKIEAAKPPPAAALPPARIPKPKDEKRIAPWRISPGGEIRFEPMPPEELKPLSPEEIAARRAGIRALEGPAVAPAPAEVPVVEEPEGTYSNPIKVSTIEEAKALPSGTIIINPAGEIRTIPPEVAAPSAVTADSMRTVTIGGRTLTVPRTPTPESRSRVKQARVEYGASLRDAERAEEVQAAAIQAERNRGGELAQQYMDFLKSEEDPTGAYENFTYIINDVMGIEPGTATTEEIYEAIDKAENFRVIDIRKAYRKRTGKLLRKKVKRFPED